MVDYSPAMMTDMYEYTMLDAALKDGTANRKCVFEIFTRHLPEGAGMGWWPAPVASLTRSSVSTWTTMICASSPTARS